MTEEIQQAAARYLETFWILILFAYPLYAVLWGVSVAVIELYRNR